MGLLERWDRRNQRILEEQDEDMKGPDWATSSKGARRGRVGASIAVAGMCMGQAARGIGGTAGLVVFVLGAVALVVVSTLALRRL